MLRVPITIMFGVLLVVACGKKDDKPTDQQAASEDSAVAGESPSEGSSSEKAAEDTCQCENAQESAEPKSLYEYMQGTWTSEVMNSAMLGNDFNRDKVFTRLELVIADDSIRMQGQCWMIDEDTLETIKLVDLPPVASKLEFPSGRDGRIEVVHGRAQKVYLGHETWCLNVLEMGYHEFYAGAESLVLGSLSFKRVK